MKTIQPRIASGFVEYSPAEQIEFNRLLTIIRSTYERYGFSPLDTTLLELSDVLLAKEAGETGKQVYQVQRSEKSDSFTLRFDLTVPLARYVAQHEASLVFPFRRYAIGKVYRAERAQAGRFREFYQCDIDVIGSDSHIVDAEFPAIINEIFEQFAFGDFTIRINNRMILNGFLAGQGLEQFAPEVLRVIDKMEKISPEAFEEELVKVGLTQPQIQEVVGFTAIDGDTDVILAKLKTLSGQSAVFDVGLERLENLVQALRMMDVPESHFAVDLRIARGLDYYTGTVYETVLNDHPEVGSVCSGGRYDNLAGLYTNTSLSGVGISIGLTRLFYKLLEAGIIKPQSQSPARIIVMPLQEGQMRRALTIAATLRAADVSAMLYTEENNLAKKMRYADRMGFAYAVLVGDRDPEGMVAVKNMQTGITDTLSIDNLLARLG